MLNFPAAPKIPAEQRAQGTIWPRYEDVTQDGRLALLALPQALGTVVWRHLLADHPVARIARDGQGIIPVLSRLVLEGFGGPVSVSRPLRADGCFELAHTCGESGEVNRLMLNIWIDVDGTVARTSGPHPPNHGEPVRLGRVFGEHVFTRLHAPPDQRKVVAFDAVGLDPVPARRYEWTDRETLSRLPAGATWLDVAPRAVAEVAFGLGHTDSNQHVNSLVYPRLFEDALLAHLGTLGQGGALLARYVDCAYRKPCFAGERVSIELRAFSLGDRYGAVGAFVPRGTGRAHCYVRMLLAP